MYLHIPGQAPKGLQLHSILYSTGPPTALSVFKLYFIFNCVCLCDCVCVVVYAWECRSSDAVCILPNVVLGTQLRPFAVQALKH